MAGHLTEDEVLEHLASFAGPGGATSYAEGGEVEDDTDPYDALSDQQDEADDAEQDRMVEQGDEPPTNTFSARSNTSGALTDEDMGISDAQMQGQGGALSDADMGLSDEDMDEAPTKKKVGTSSVILKHALHEAPSAIATLPAMGAMATAGASIGTAVFPGVGTVAGGMAGGLIGALSGGYINSKIMDWIYGQAGLKNKGAYFDPEQMHAEDKEHPFAAAVGDLLPNVAGFKFDKGASAATRVAGALLQGGLEGGQELAAGEFDPARLALNTAAGAALTKPRAPAAKLMGFGERVANIGKPTAAPGAGGVDAEVGQGSERVPGRPAHGVTPELEAERANVNQDDVTTVAQGVAADNPPVNTKVNVGGNLSPVRSTRTYPKDKLKNVANENATSSSQTTIEVNGELRPDLVPSQKGVTLSEGIHPDVQSALDTANKSPTLDLERKTNNAPNDFEMNQPRSEADFGDAAIQSSKPKRQPRTPRAPEHVTVKGDETPPGPVYPHPELPGVQVDRTKMVPKLVDISPDGKTVLVDQRLPPTIDVAGKQLDPALPLGARASVARQVANGPGATRALAKEAGMTAERVWLESRDYDYEAYKKALRGSSGEQTAKPGDAAIAQARALMAKMPKALEKFNSLPPEKQANAARLVLEMQTNKRGKLGTTEYATARVPSKPATVEGVGTTARTKGEAQMRSNVVKAANEAFEKFKAKDDIVPTSKPQKEALRARLAMAVEYVQRVGTYMPRDKSTVPALKWIKDARSLINGRMTQRQIAQFIANEKLLRSGNKEAVKDVVQTSRIEGDIARSRTPTVEDAELANAARNDQGPLTDEQMRATAQEEPSGKEIDWQNLSTEDLDAMAAAKSAADAAVKPKVEKAIPAWKQQEQARAAKMAEQKAAREKKGGVTATVKKFIKNEEGGAPIPQGAKDFAAKVKEFVTRKPSEDYIAAAPKSAEEAYARSIDDRLYATDKQSVNNRTQLRHAADSWPEKFKTEAVQAKLYRAIETEDFSHLTPEERAFYHNDLKPIKDATDQMAKLVAQIDPEFEYHPDTGHIHRIAKGFNPQLDKAGGQAISAISADPIHSVDRSLSTTTSALKERVFMEIEDKNGNRKVISPTDDGFHVWTRGQSSRVKNPVDAKGNDLEVKVGNTYRDKNGNDWQIVRAITPNIERHARFRNGKMAEYYQNGALSILKAHADIYDVLQHMKLLENLKNDPKFQALATRSNNMATQEGWSKEPTKLYPFDKYYMHPEMKAVFDHYAQPGFEGEVLDKWRNLSRGITKLMFWMPTAHIANVGNHWFVARGWDWMTPHGYRSLAVNGAKAIKSVMSQDQLQSTLRDNGAGTILGGVLNENWLRNIGRQVGMELEKNPTKWDPVLKSTGLKSIKDLADAIYHASSKVMWAANDVFYTQHVLELMDKGMSVKQAIQKTDRHIPNYRVPAKVLGSQGISKVMSDPGFTAFGRYHYGVFNSYAHMIKSAVNGTPEQRKEAIGQMMMVGVLAFVIKPVLDKMAQYVTGNKNAEVRGRGPIALPLHFIHALQGKETFTEGPKTVVTAAPVISWGKELYDNTDFAQRRVYEQGDVRKAMRGDVKAAGRVGVQVGEHALRNLVSPYGTVASAYGRGQDPLDTIRNQALDIKEPSPRSLRWQRMQLKRDRSEAAHRAMPGRARGPMENIYNKLTR